MLLYLPYVVAYAYISRVTSKKSGGRTTYQVEPLGKADLDQHRLVARVRHDELDCILMASRNHYLACWTMTLDGRREVVALEVHPKRAPFPSGVEALGLVKEWLFPRTRDLASVMPKKPTPITTESLLGLIPLSTVLKAREEVIARDRGADSKFSAALSVASPEGTVQDYPHLTPSQASHLIDAAMYVDALKRGSRSPASVVAERRGISVRTAQGRIAKARELGYLTPIPQGHVGGDLTQEARKSWADLAAWAGLDETTGEAVKNG